MKPLTAVIDTNIVVSGLITASLESPVCQILDGMLKRRFPFLLSLELLDEYRRVLLRPKVRGLHGLDASEVDVLLAEIVANAIFREPQDDSTTSAPDQGDDHLWRLLATQQNVILVTGDDLLLAQPPDFASVISARGFLAMLGV